MSGTYFHDAAFLVETWLKYFAVFGRTKLDLVVQVGQAHHGTLEKLSIDLSLGYIMIYPLAS